ncbi:MAG TPA: flagellar motor protein MotB [Candidatus Binatia bacterium]|nr:flagellar motor protein MotB [Candidatus Binatia bacterium]
MSAPDPQMDLMAAMPVPVETPQPPWLMSFLDFMSCLLCSFVLLYSLVAVDQEKLDRILAGVPGRQVTQAIPPSAEKRAMEAVPQADGRNTDYLTSLLKAKLEHEPALVNVVVEGQGDRVVLHLAAKDLLSVTASGEEPGRQLVFALAGALSTVPNRVAVEVRPDRPTEFSGGLGYAVKLAQRLEAAGAPGPIMPRARLASAGEAAGIDLVIFDKAPEANP